jgi:acyl-CoA thioesterase
LLFGTFAVVITPEQLAIKVVAQMYDNDPFSKWLGIERSTVAPGVCVLQMTVRNEMLNGFKIAHGGITYALADSCLAFASNSYGIQAVSVETSISHTRPVKEGDRLTAEATEKSRTSRIAIYHINVTDQNNTLVALFKGTVYRTGKLWFPEDQPNPIT